MLSHGLDCEVVYKRKRYRLDLSYDNVLRWYELQRDPWFDDVARLDLSLQMFVKGLVKLP